MVAKLKEGQILLPHILAEKLCYIQVKRLFQLS